MQTYPDLQVAGRGRVESTLRAMHAIQAANGELDFTAQVRTILEIGTRQLGLPVGLVSRLDGEQVSLPYVVGGGDALPEGTVVRACDSFCGESIAQRRRLVIDDAEHSEFRDHPGNTLLGLKAYLGQPIYVDDAIWGTVCFLDMKRRGSPFTDVDLDLFELICQRIQVGIEHEAIVTGFRTVLGGTVSVTGDGFFRSLVSELGRGLKVDTAFVAERLPDDANGPRARTLAIWRDGALVDNVDYRLKDTADESLSPHPVTCHPDEIQRLFPNDSNAGRLNLRGYAGIALTSHEGHALGYLVASSRKRLDLKTHERWLVEIFAGRASAELERVRSDAEQRRLEREMLHSEKLKSLGVLAGGIAHDFNNLLTGIIGNVDLIEMEAPAGSQLADRVAQIDTASKRAASLIKQMLAYSGRGAFVVEPMDVNTVVQDVTELLDSAVSKNVVLQRTFAEDLPSIEADHTQVRQVLMNLLMNASDALEGEPGTVSLRTGLVDVSADELPEYVVGGGQMEPGTFVYIEVEDVGVGMSAQTQPRMFDPFFTTKASGTGLGLSAALGIVRDQRGGIRVRSDIGEGTCVRVVFPESARAGSTESASASRPASGSLGATVLVVDDEDVVRNVGCEILRRFGMAAISARDGVEALAVFEKHRAEIDVVLLDLSMPGMGGRAAAQRIRQIDSTTPVVLMSGFDEQETRRSNNDSSCERFLQKPFTAASLLEVVQELAPFEGRGPSVSDAA